MSHAVSGASNRRLATCFVVWVSSLVKCCATGMKHCRPIPISDPIRVSGRIVLRSTERRRPDQQARNAVVVASPFDDRNLHRHIPTKILLQVCVDRLK